MRIEEEINQKVFRNTFIKAQINLMFTASWMDQHVNKALKKLRISWQQFNILRILKGMHPEPATVKLLTERMIDKMSNASRLVEKLKQKELVYRIECPEDRRKVNVGITEKGLQLVDNASKLVESRILDCFNALTEEEAVQLNDLLDKLRG
ncbi:MAG: MarR family transcriptional regulator [Saprospirales bacterium]|nr:MarR family transcriptional regulator [Saprospirales bacterium]MBK8490983.1 MarR family transcriptional regulator [Saprospirales bacterium]